MRLKETEALSSVLVVATKILTVAMTLSGVVLLRRACCYRLRSVRGDVRTRAKRTRPLVRSLWHLQRPTRRRGVTVRLSGDDHDR